MNTLTQDEDNRIPRGALTAIEEIIMVASVMAEVPWAGGMIDMFLNFLNGTQKDNNSLEMLWNRMQTAMHQFVEKNIFDESNRKEIEYLNASFKHSEQQQENEFLKKHNIYYIVPWIMPVELDSGSAKINNQTEDNEFDG